MKVQAGFREPIREGWGSQVASESSCRFQGKQRWMERSELWSWLHQHGSHGHRLPPTHRWAGRKLEHEVAWPLSFYPPFSSQSLTLARSNRSQGAKKIWKLCGTLANSFFCRTALHIAPPPTTLPQISNMASGNGTLLRITAFPYQTENRFSCLDSPMAFGKKAVDSHLQPVSKC